MQMQCKYTMQPCKYNAIIHAGDVAECKLPCKYRWACICKPMQAPCKPMQAYANHAASCSLMQPHTEGKVVHIHQLLQQILQDEMTIIRTS